MKAATALALVPAEEQIPSPVVPYVETNPVSVLLDEGLRGRFFSEIEQEIASSPVDLATKKGRDVIKSLAYKIARTKTAIDDAGKKLNEQRRKEINAVDERRRDCKTKLEAFQDRARKPLDEWEAAEKEREDKIKETLAYLDGCRAIHVGDTSEMLQRRIMAIELIPDEEAFVDAKQRALDTLKAGIDRLAREEAERAELARLRAEQAERERVEAEKQAAERREKEAAERKEREEKAVQERILAAEKRAADDAAAAERRAAEQAAAKDKAEADAEIARINAEKRKLEEAEEARKAEEKRAADEAAARQKDKEHMAKVMTAAKEAFMDEAALDEATSKKLVRLISFGKIPNVSIRF